MAVKDGAVPKDAQNVQLHWQRCNERTVDDARNYRDVYSFSTTTIEDVNSVTRVPLIVVSFFVLLLSLVAFWSSIFLLSSRDVPEETPYSGHRAGSLVITVIQRPEIPMIPLSAFIFFTASFGFLGGLRENVCFLTTHAVLLTFVTLVLIVAAGVAIFLPPIARNYVKNSMSTDFILAYRESEDIQSVIDWFQMGYRCCGLTTESYRDWSLNPYFKCDKDNPSKERCSVPYSCCRKNESDVAAMLPNVMCGAKVLQQSDQKAWSKVYTRSCADALFASLQENTVFVVTACTMACLLTVLMVAFTMSVRSDVRSLSAIYNVYYQNVAGGQKRIREEHGSRFSVPEPKAPVSVTGRLAYLIRGWLLGSGDEKGPAITVSHSRSGPTTSKTRT